jgi:hypothetical protein
MTTLNITDALYHSKTADNIYLEIINGQKIIIEEQNVVIDRLRELIRRNNIVHSDIDLTTGLSVTDLSMLGMTGHTGTIPSATSGAYGYHPPHPIHRTGPLGLGRQSILGSISRENLSDIDRNNSNLIASIMGTSGIPLRATTISTSTARDSDKAQKAREFNITESQVEVLDIVGKKPESGVPPTMNERLDAVFKNAGIIDNRVINSLLSTFPLHFGKIAMGSDSF